MRIASTMFVCILFVLGLQAQHQAPEALLKFNDTVVLQHNQNSLISMTPGRLIAIRDKENNRYKGSLVEVNDQQVVVQEGDVTHFITTNQIKVMKVYGNKLRRTLGAAVSGASVGVYFGIAIFGPWDGFGDIEIMFVTSAVAAVGVFYVGRMITRKRVRFNDSTRFIFNGR